MNKLLMIFFILFSIHNNKKQHKYNIYGTWKIVKYYVPYVTSFNNIKDIDYYNGKKIKICTDKIITPFDAPFDSFKHISYDYKKELTLKYFYSEWRDNVTMNSVGIKSDSIMVVNAEELNRRGKKIGLFNFLIKNDSTAVLDSYKGVFFLLRRVNEKKKE